MPSKSLASKFRATPRDHQLASELQKAFGAEFTFWSKTDDWQPSSLTDEAARQQTCTDDEAFAFNPDWLEHAAGGEAALVEALRPSLLQLALPLHQLSSKFAVATAHIRETSVEHLQRQADLFLQWARLNREHLRLVEVNDALTAQVTENFEELACIRMMTAHLQLPTSATEPTSAIQQLLGKLQQTIKAEGLALVLTDPDNSNDCEFPQIKPPIYWSDRELLSPERCQSLINCLGSAASERPTIVNHVQSTLLHNEFPEFRQFVLIRVGHSVLRGWFLAVNRCLDYEKRQNYRVSEQEFGTVEATLLLSAAASVATHFHNLELLRQKEELFTEIVRALVNAVEARDPYTCGHSERVALFSQKLGQAMGLDGDACDRLYLSGLLHDVGKIGVSDAALRNPGRLTDEEFQEISRHPDQGWAILRDLAHLQDIMPGVLYHHERYDGNGYPMKLKGEKIPLEGRIMAIADAYDAMTSDRPYRDGMAQDKAEAILREGAGSQWDPGLVEIFLAAMPEIVQIRKSYVPRVYSAASPKTKKSQRVVSQA